jgi:hypothetical protein
MGVSLGQPDSIRHQKQDHNGRNSDFERQEFEIDVTRRPFRERRQIVQHCIHRPIAGFTIFPQAPVDNARQTRRCTLGELFRQP